MHPTRRIVATTIALSTSVAALGAAGVGPAGAHPHHRRPSVRVYDTRVEPLVTLGGVRISGEAFGSAIARVPGHAGEVYGLTDRGPNVDGPNDSKVEPLPRFTPAIGRFRLRHGHAELVRRIPLRAADGTPYNGQVNTIASTGETITDLDGHVLPASADGYDPEGLVALKDGSFWVSDEYGPFITHFDRHGRQVGRLSPYAGTLPAELRNRGVNRGMEGLTVTPDGRTLVGMMQSALDQPDLTTTFKDNALVRIVTVGIRSRRVHEYPYLLTDPGDTGTAVSEIAALSRHRFLVLERDGQFDPGAFKRVFAVDTAHATDIGPDAAVPGSSYHASGGGLLHGGATLEQTVGDAGTSAAEARLRRIGIVPVTKALRLDIGALVTRIDPSGGFFGHDKLEGLAVYRHGRRLLVSNDNDFGIVGVEQDAAPFTLTPKLLPNGQQDDGELLSVDLN